MGSRGQLGRSERPAPTERDVIAMTAGAVDGDRLGDQPAAGEDYLLTREAAHLLRTPESTLRYWRYIRTGPPSIKIGRRVLYRREALIAWVQGREVGAEEGPTAHNSAFQVSGPQMPSAVSPALFWKSITACLVTLP